MKPNRQYFIVKIDKKQQEIKRQKIILGGSGYLGIRHSEQDYTGPGVVIVGAEKDSPAYKSGLKGGDIIMSVNGEAVTTFENLVDLIARYKPGDTVILKIKSSLLITEELTEKKVVLGEKKISLENPEHLRDMRHNLQFGKIISIGKNAAKSFPEASRGDILLFHHSVEYKPRTENDSFYNDFHHVDTDSRGNELRIVDKSFEVLGVLKLNPSPIIIPHPRWVFCHYQIEKSSMQQDAKTGLWLPDKWEQSMEDLIDKLDKLKAQIQEISSSTIMKKKENERTYKRLAEIRGAIKLLNQERRIITRKMHQSKLVEVTVLYYNKKSTDTLGYDLSAGDKVICDFHSLYPLDIQGVCYSLARVGSIEAAIFQKNPLQKINKLHAMDNNSTNLFRPLHDRIIVLPFEKDVISDGGVIIPGTADNKPGLAEVIACGPGTKDEPMQAKKGDIIIYNIHDGTDMPYKGKSYLALREDSILTTLTPEESKDAIAQNERTIAKKEELRLRDEEQRSAIVK